MEKVKTFDIVKYGKKHPLSIKIGRYHNGNMAIEAFTHEEGYPEPWSKLTVNLNVETKKFCAFIDVENNGDELVEVLEKNDFGVLTGMGCVSYGTVFPEFEFNPDTLKEYDVDGFEEYDAYADALEFVRES